MISVITPPLSLPSKLNTFATQAKREPHFGRATIRSMVSFSKLPRPSLLLRNFDFHLLGDSILTQSKLIYGALIASRAVFARTNNERWEVLRRDPFGWYCWFYGKPLLEWAIIQTATSADPKLRQILKNPLPHLGTPFNPPSQSFQTTQPQLKDRLAQITRNMEKMGVNGKRLREVEKIFARANNLLAVTTFVGLVFTIFSLGIGINLMNIAITRANVRRQHQGHIPT